MNGNRFTLISIFMEDTFINEYNIYHILYSLFHRINDSKNER